MFRAKAREWLPRYGLAELSGTATAYLGYFTGRGMFPDSEVAQAYLASVCETLGFYTVIVTRQVRADRARARRRLQDCASTRSAISLTPACAELSLTRLWICIRVHFFRIS